MDSCSHPYIAYVLCALQNYATIEEVEDIWLSFLQFLLQFLSLSLCISDMETYVVAEGLSWPLLLLFVPKPFLVFILVRSARILRLVSHDDGSRSSPYQEARLPSQIVGCQASKVQPSSYRKSDLLMGDKE